MALVVVMKRACPRYDISKVPPSNSPKLFSNLTFKFHIYNNRLINVVSYDQIASKKKLRPADAHVGLHS